MAKYCRWFLLSQPQWQKIWASQIGSSGRGLGWKLKYKLREKPPPSHHPGWSFNPAEIYNSNSSSQNRTLPQFLGSTSNKKHLNPPPGITEVCWRISIPIMNTNFYHVVLVLFPIEPMHRNKDSGNPTQLLSSWFAELRLFGPSKGINEVSLVRKFHVGFEVWFKNQLHSNVLGWLSWLQSLPPFKCAFVVFYTPSSRVQVWNHTVFFGEEKTYQEKTTDNI